MTGFHTQCMARSRTAAPWRSGAAPITGRSTRATGFLRAEARVDTLPLTRNDRNIIYLTGTYGSVSRFDRRTSFSQDITPWPVATWNKEIVERKYRDPWTPVLLFSPFDKKSLYLGTQFVMKTMDGGLHWEKISPDLTGAAKPAGGKPVGPATVENSRERGYGVVSTIAASPLRGDLIWAGSDTGLIHLTRDGGKTWQNVTPKGLTDWSRISLIEASHFDPAEAYAAVDRHRLDDQQPYLYRTRDYGASWQLITDGIPAPSFLRAVRQDSKDSKLLFAGTELGIYVSFDDGDHWQSLQLNLPATSVQDMVIHGDDLVIATHGRSFWILDDITALRQAKRSIEAGAGWLFSPAAAVRVDNDRFLGTPLPPEEPAAKNPPDGAIIDYYLDKAAAHVKLEIFDTRGNLLRGFASIDPKNDTKDDRKEPSHASPPIAQRWFPKPEVVETGVGMHRFVWDLGVGRVSNPDENGNDEEWGAPHAPRVIPGTYEVRLTVDGKTLREPLKVIMDPRSVATAAELEQQFQLGREMFAEAIHARQTLAEIHSVQARLTMIDQKLSAQQSELKARVEQVQDAIKQILDGAGAHEGDDMGLDLASAGLAGALRVVESSDRAVPSQATAVFEESKRAVKLRTSEWNHVTTTLLPPLNDELKRAGEAPGSIGEHGRG